jgi:hypothetical protein
MQPFTKAEENPDNYKVRKLPHQASKEGNDGKNADGKFHHECRTEPVGSPTQKYQRHGIGEEKDRGRLGNLDMGKMKVFPYDREKD